MSKKRKFSKGATRFQKVERGASKSTQRLARAVEIGLQEWTERRNKSARKRPDGAIRDAAWNGAFATGRAMREAGWGPSEFFNTVNTKDKSRDPRRAWVRAILPFWR